MIHARPDYNRIQDPAGLIPKDEPVFLIRGQDYAGPPALRAWADAAEALGAPADIVKAARDQADAFELYAGTVRGKVPDMYA